MIKAVYPLLLGAALGAQEPAPPAQAPAAPAPSGRLVGAPRPAFVDSPVVLDAKSFIQKHLAILRLDGIREAHTQVVAGIKVRLLCLVTDEDETGLWEFVAWRQPDGRWRFLSATAVAPARIPAPETTP